MTFHRILVILVSGLLPGIALGGTLETLSQGSNWLWTLGKGCPGFDPNTVRMELNCLDTDFQRQTRNLAKESAAIASDQEDRFFGQLALREAKELRCGQEFAKIIALGESGESTDGIKELVTRIRLMREARISLDESVKKLSSHGVDNLSFCSKEIPENSNPYFKICHDYYVALAAFNVLSSSIPLSVSPDIDKVIGNYIYALGRAIEGGLRNKLELSLREAYRKTGENLAASATELEKTVKEKGGAGFGRPERHALMADPAITDQVVQAMGDSSDSRALARCADARYGQGADQLSNTVAIGSVLLMGGGAVLLRAGSLTAKAVEASLQARSAGAISFNAMNMLRAGAITLGGTGSVESVVEACPHVGVRVQDGCTSAPQISELNSDSCALASFLALVGFGTVATQGGKALLRQLRSEVKPTGPPLIPNLPQGPIQPPTQATALTVHMSSDSPYTNTEGDWYQARHYESEQHTWDKQFPNYEADHSQVLGQTKILAVDRCKELGLSLADNGDIGPLDGPKLTPLGDIIGRLKNNYGISFKLGTESQVKDSWISFGANGGRPTVSLNFSGLRESPTYAFQKLIHFEHMLKMQKEFAAQGVELTPMDSPTGDPLCSLKVVKAPPGGFKSNDPLLWIKNRAARGDLQVVIGDSVFTSDGQAAFTANETVHFRWATFENREANRNVIGHELFHAEVINRCIKYQDCAPAIEFIGAKVPGVPEELYSEFRADEMEAYGITGVLSPQNASQLKTAAREFGVVQKQVLEKLQVQLRDSSVTVNQSSPSFKVNLEQGPVTVTLPLGQKFASEEAARQFWQRIVDQRLRQVTNQLQRLH